MYKVIDTTSYANGWVYRYPELAERGEGVMAILEPNQIKLAPDIQGLVVTVHTPNGETLQLVATDSSAHHSVVGIFFGGVSAEKTPRGSEIEW
jgi:hypothetical protein